MKYKFLCISLLFLSCSDDDGNAPLNTTNDAVVNIISVSQITENSATVIAEVISSSENVTERGIVWSASGTPTVDDNTINSGNGLGEFQVTIQGLDPETNFQIRAFARTASGVGYSGSNSFETLDSCNGNVFVGDVFINSQDELDSFAANNFCEVQGFILIETNRTPQVVDLTPLSSLKKVGNLIIRNNNILESLEGLENITTITIGVTIGDNPLLESISHLSPKGETGFIKIFGNDNLSTVDNFNDITALTLSEDGISLLISVSESLPSITGFSNLTNVKGDVRILNSPNIENLSGLSALTTVENGSLVVSGLGSLETLNGLENITSVGGDLRISNNNILSNLNSLSALSSINGALEIRNNRELMNVDGISGIEEGVSSIEFSDNAVESITLSSVPNQLIELQIREDNLTTLSGFDNLTTINGQLFINGGLFTDLDFLSNLSQVNTINIDDSSLTNLDGLGSILNCSDFISITRNQDLVDFCGLQNLLINGIFTGEYIVTQNAFNPTQQDIINGNCSQ